MGLMSCHVSANFQLLFYAHMLLLPITGGVLFIARWLALRHRKSINAQRGKSAKFSENTVHKRMYSLSQIMCFILYAGLCTRIARVFKCVQIQNRWWLEAEMEVECFVGSHLGMVFVAVIGVGVYVLGIPMFQLCVLFKHKHRLEERHVRHMWGSIYREYKSTYWYFEVVAMMRRFCLTALMVYLSGEDPVPQIVISMLVGLAWLYILTKWKPYKDHESSWVGEVLALQMLLNLLLMLALTAWRKSEELVTGTEYYNRVAFNFFLIGTNAVCTIIAILVVLVSLPHASEVWKKLKKKGASFCNMLPCMRRVVRWVDQYMQSEKSKNASAEAFVGSWTWSDVSPFYKHEMKRVVRFYPQETQKVLESEKFANEMTQFLALTARTELEETQEQLVKENENLQQKTDRLEQETKDLVQHWSELKEKCMKMRKFMPLLETKNTYFLSHYQEEGATLGEKLKTSIENLGGGCWLDVDEDDRSEKSMEEGIQKQDIFLAIVSPMYFTRTFCIKELEWAVQYGKPMIVVVDVKVKKQKDEIMKTVPLRLKNIGKRNWIDLNRGDKDYWKTGIQKVLKTQPEPLAFAPS